MEREREANHGYAPRRKTVRKPVKEKPPPSALGVNGAEIARALQLGANSIARLSGRLAKEARMALVDQYVVDAGSPQFSTAQLLALAEHFDHADERAYVMLRLMPFMMLDNHEIATPAFWARAKVSEAALSTLAAFALLFMSEDQMNQELSVLDGLHDVVKQATADISKVYPGPTGRDIFRKPYVTVPPTVLLLLQYH